MNLPSLSFTSACCPTHPCSSSAGRSITMHHTLWLPGAVCAIDTCIVVPDGEGPAADSGKGDHSQRLGSQHWRPRLPGHPAHLWKSARRAPHGCIHHSQRSRCSLPSDPDIKALGTLSGHDYLPSLSDGSIVMSGQEGYSGQWFCEDVTAGLTPGYVCFGHSAATEGRGAIGG